MCVSVCFICVDKNVKLHIMFLLIFVMLTVTLSNRDPYQMHGRHNNRGVQEVYREGYRTGKEIPGWFWFLVTFLCCCN